MMEEIGDDYLKILLQSSLLEEIRCSWGVYYKMHDLVHDLAKSVLKFGSINLETSVIDHNYQVRYLAVNTSEEKTVKLLGNIFTSVRTLFVERGISGEMLSKLKNLHVLYLSGLETLELPSSIGKLIHMRYITVKLYAKKTLPESICKLYNLQTLRIDPCYSYLIYLPEGMSNLISLRHLHCSEVGANFQMPLHMGRLSCLQTLEFFNVGQEKGHQIEELGCLKDLKGKLMIRNLELVKGKEGAEKANLSGKANLFRLKFEWGSRNQEGYNCDKDVLEGLLPHPNLQRLVILNFMGDQFPQWFMNLSALAKLKLKNCKRCRELPIGLGQLPFLQHLRLIGLEYIRCIGLSFYGIDEQSTGSNEVSRKSFPALKTLILKDMENLVEWMEAKADVLSVLETLMIVNCSKLTAVPSHFPSLKKLSITNNDHILVVKKILSQATTTLSSLEIKGMAGLTCVSDVAADLHTNLSNVKKLSLMKCPNLTSARGYGSSLESLYIWNCENLSEFLEDRFQFQSLRRLWIIECPRILYLNGLQNLTSLQELTISYCDGLTNLPGEVLDSCKYLQRLAVYKCPNLISFTLDLQHTPSLSEIKLFGCPKLKTNMMPRGFGFLTSLRELQIGPIADNEENALINEFDWAGLISSSTLRQLELYGLPQMESLRYQLQYLTTLPSLILRDFGIEALPDWIENLVSLESMHLWNCEMLQYLPSTDAMKRLTKLTCLQVHGCPLLMESCTSQSGPNSEWYKISHFPRLRIY